MKPESGGSANRIQPRCPRPVLKLTPRKKDPWSLAKSVFRGYRDETKGLSKRAFEADWKRFSAKIERLVKDPEEVDAVKDILAENAKLVRDIHRHYSTLSTGDPFSLASNAFIEFCNGTKITGSENCELKDLDTIFIATNYMQKKDRNIPERSIVRFQFIEAIVRLAQAKYGQALPQISLAIDKLFSSNIVPFFGASRLSHFRHEYLWHSFEVERIFGDHMEGLLKSYKEYAGKQTIAAGGARGLSLQEFEMLCAHSGLVTRRRR